MVYKCVYLYQYKTRFIHPCIVHRYIIGKAFLRKGEILGMQNAPEMCFFHWGSVVIGASMLLELFIRFVIQIQ